MVAVDVLRTAGSERCAVMVGGGAQAGIEKATWSSSPTASRSTAPVG
jgi:hypothetical protein